MNHQMSDFYYGSGQPESDILDPSSTIDINDLDLSRSDLDLAPYFDNLEGTNVWREPPGPFTQRQYTDIESYGPDPSFTSLSNSDWPYDGPESNGWSSVNEGCPQLSEISPSIDQTYFGDASVTSLALEAFQDLGEYDVFSNLSDVVQDVGVTGLESEKKSRRKGATGRGSLESSRLGPTERGPRESRRLGTTGRGPHESSRLGATGRRSLESSRLGPTERGPRESRRLECTSGSRSGSWKPAEVWETSIRHDEGTHDYHWTVNEETSLTGLRDTKSKLPLWHEEGGYEEGGYEEGGLGEGRNEVEGCAFGGNEEGETAGGNEEERDEEEFEGYADGLLKKIASKRQRRRHPRIWEFLMRLIASGSEYIEMTNPSEGVFRLIDPQKITESWAARSLSSVNLSYYNFARALRYHYKKGTLRAVNDKHLVYACGPPALKFLRELLEQNPTERNQQLLSQLGHTR